MFTGVPVIFAGGPVWATAWVPVPDNGNHHQYLAVATHPGVEETHEMSAVYNYKSLIQVWSFGHLNNCELVETYPCIEQRGLTTCWGSICKNVATWCLHFCKWGWISSINSLSAIVVFSLVISMKGQMLKMAHYISEHTIISRFNIWGKTWSHIKTTTPPLHLLDSDDQDN